MKDSRIADLEVRMAYQELAFEQLSEQIVAQQRSIDELIAKVAYLAARLRALRDSGLLPPSIEV